MSGAGERRRTLPLSALALSVVALPLLIEVAVPLQVHPVTASPAPLPAATPAVDALQDGPQARTGAPTPGRVPGDAASAETAGPETPGSPGAAGLSSALPSAGPSGAPWSDPSVDASPDTPAAGPSNAPSSGPSVDASPHTPVVPSPPAPVTPVVGTDVLTFAQDTLLDPTVSGHVTGRTVGSVSAQRLEQGVWKDRATAPVRADGSYTVALAAGHGERRADRWRIVTAGAAGPEISVQRLGVVRPVVRRATRADVQTSWQEGCPVHWRELIVMEANHYGFDGRMHRGTIVLRDIHQQRFVDLLQRAIDVDFPIAKMRSVEAYGGSDDASAADNNTSGFNCRRTPLGTYWSEHSRGAAIDLNPVQNPYNKAGKVIPGAGRQYLDRSRKRPGMLTPDSPLIVYAEANHWLWLNPSDYQHLEQPSPEDT